MPEPPGNLSPAPGAASGLARLGVVVHPSRKIDAPLNALRRWAQEHDADLVQIAIPGHDRRIADVGDVAGCDLIISIGGDGTMLAALRAALTAGRPTLGVACGSLGVLTAIEADGLAQALDRFSRREWIPRRLPALAIAAEGGEDLLALNDLVILRAGIGQVRVTTSVDGVLYTRLAGDGCIVSTALGSTAYALAAGSALLTPETEAYLLTPLSTHGGFRQPLVISAETELRLEINQGVGGAKLEIDGQAVDVEPPDTLSVRLRADVATMVTFADQEPLLAALRRRRLIVDSPRIVAERERD